MKKFLAMAAVAVMALSSCCTPAKKIGIELYSVRELIGNPELYAANHAEVLSAIAEMGYTGVEAACYGDGKFYGVEPEQFKADCEAAGLEVVSAHICMNPTAEELANHDFTRILNDWKVAVDASVRAGMRYVIDPSFPVPSTLEGLKAYCDFFNEVGKLFAEVGIPFGYHNHSHEFGKVEDQVVYDFLLENTDPALVFFQMDVYWACMGKAAPVEYFKRYPGRFPLLHIKDVAEVGQSGMVGFDAIFNASEISGMKEYIVEMEGSSYGDILRTCKESAEYLLAAPFVK
ncbi:MAG: sugar phosphate isomerase/epimerase [Bacteroidales bacterium]|nr:sugar phosphate isomerase/epimerase [Bacteroidales bacterium]